MPLIYHLAGHGGEGSALAAALKRPYHSERNQPVPEQTNIESRRASLALLAGLLLVAGMLLGHPDMSSATQCTGGHDIGCTEEGGQCEAYCPTLTGALPCVIDHCAVVSGFCYCKVVP